MAAIYADLKTALGKITNFDKIFENQIHSEETKKIFIQAASQVSTDASISFFANKIVQGDLLDAKTIASFYYHASFAAHPTEQSVALFLDLIRHMRRRVKIKISKIYTNKPVYHW